MTLTQQEYLKFWDEIGNRLKKVLPVNLPNPPTRSYYQLPIGISGFHFEWAFHGRPRSSFGVELHFEKGNAEANQIAFMKIEKLKSQ